MLNQFDQKMLECFYCFSAPNDTIMVAITINDKKDTVTFETISRIPLAHKMSVEQFLNTPVDALKAIAKGLYKEMRIVG